jgi:hypothetical protein
MSEREVDRIVRARPGYYGDYHEYFYQWYSDRHSRVESETGERGIRSVVWGSRDGLLTIYFDVDGRVCGKHLVHFRDREPSHPERWGLLRRLYAREWPDPEPTGLIFSPF